MFVTHLIKPDLKTFRYMLKKILCILHTGLCVPDIVPGAKLLLNDIFFSQLSFIRKMNSNYRWMLFSDTVQ